MFRVKSKHSYVDLFEGIIIGGSLAAAATFLFGTKKGKDLQKDLVKEYKKLGHTTKDMKRKLEKAIKKQAARKVKRAVKLKRATKTRVRKATKRVRAKIRAVKRQAYRRAA
jgi:gas vesicle protein